MNKPAGKPAATPVDRFAALIGEKYALRDPADMAPYLAERRDLYQGHAAAVLKPGSTKEVAAILMLANETGTPVVPQGGNTGLSGGQVPFDERAVVVSTARLDKIREIDLATNSMTCEAGVILQRAQEEARKNERLFPLSLGAEGSCTIGGNLSTNAGGTNALTYGVARDLVLGLEVVLADGRIWNGLRKLKKDNTGYDLRHLFVGAEGTLGIITAAVLKLFPAPRSLETAFVGVASPQAALELLKIAQARAGNAVTSFELMTRTGVELALRHPGGARDPLARPHAWYALMELSSPAQTGLRATMEEILAAGSEQGIVEDATIAASLEQSRQFWHLRLVLPEAQMYTGGSIAHDVSVPVAAVPAFIDDASAAVVKVVPGARPLPFGHLGDGNMHFTVCRPESMERAAFLARTDEVNNAVYALVAKHRGSISAEHGIGVMKRELLPGVKDPVELEMMRAIKQLLDPKRILNPGKVL
ncbi:MAG: FAD-binding oxidoreductase [Xanthobacteraceae bacterium]